MEVFVPPPPPSSSPLLVALLAGFFVAVVLALSCYVSCFFVKFIGMPTSRFPIIPLRVSKFNMSFLHLSTQSTPVRQHSTQLLQLSLLQ